MKYTMSFTTGLVTTHLLGLVLGWYGVGISTYLSIGMMLINWLVYVSEKGGE